MKTIVDNARNHSQDDITRVHAAARSVAEVCSVVYDTCGG